MYLCNRLEKMCGEGKVREDLPKRLADICSSAEHIWEHPRLQWFPDHTVTHSERIIEKLGEVLYRLEGNSHDLSPYELYILLAACYLHDIGMQDIRVDGRHSDKLTIHDYEVIRTTHPKRSREMIVSGSKEPTQTEFKIHIQDSPQFTKPIAIVSQGHGTQYFDRSIQELKDGNYRPHNERMRGDLLTALLLMGDELDLHEDRARFPENSDPSPVAAFHNHVHHYVTGVEVLDGNTPKERRISISFEYPEHSEAYREDVRWWVVNKLLAQKRRTQPVIFQATEGQLAWDRKIEVRESVDRDNSRRELPHESQLLLRYDILKHETINRQGLVETIENALSYCNQRHQFIELNYDRNSDWSHISKLFDIIAKLHNAKTVRHSFSMSIGNEPMDILDRCYKQLVDQGLSCLAYHKIIEKNRGRRHGSLEESYIALLDDIKCHGLEYPILLLFEDITNMAPKTSEWLEQSFFRAMAEESIPAITVVSHEGPLRFPKYGQCHALEPFSQDALAYHLSSKLGYPEIEAKDKAQEIHGLSQGTPLWVIAHLIADEKKLTEVK